MFDKDLLLKLQKTVDFLLGFLFTAEGALGGEDLGSVTITIHEPQKLHAHA